SMGATSRSDGGVRLSSGGGWRATHMSDFRKIEPAGRKDPLVALTQKIREPGREQQLGRDGAGKAPGSLDKDKRGALAGCILLFLELIVDIVTSLLHPRP